MENTNTQNKYTIQTVEFEDLVQVGQVRTRQGRADGRILEPCSAVLCFAHY